MPASGDDEKQNKAPRKKRWATKVRTGCLMCRTRHLKCDEGEPSCRRCLVGGRECQYPYGLQQQQQQSKHGIEPISPTALVASPPHAGVSPYNCQPTQVEHELLSLYTEHVAPQLSGVFDGDFWTVVAPQASRVYPAIWHALLAMSAMHRWKLSEGSLVRYGYYEMGLRQCNKSIACLTKIATDSPTAADQEALLMGSILLSSFCNLQGDLREITMHAYKGLFLFKQMGRGNNSYWATDPSPKDVVASAALIAPLFTRLEALVTNAPHEAPCSSWDLPQDTESLHTEPFESITEAYVELFPLLHNFFRVANREGYWWSATTGQRSPDYRHPYRRAFTTWKIRFHAFHRGAHSPRETVAETGIEGTRLSILRIWELCFESCLDMDAAEEELGWDRCKPCFTRLVQLAEKLLLRASAAAGQPNDKLQLASLVTMIGEPLYSLAAVCRDVVLRRKAIELLRKYPHREGHFDSHVLVRLAETRVKIEEEAVLSSRSEDGCQCVRGNFVCNMHRIVFPAPKYYEDGCIVTQITTVDDVKKNSIGHKLKISWGTAQTRKPAPRSMSSI